MPLVHALIFKCSKLCAHLTYWLGYVLYLYELLFSKASMLGFRLCEERMPAVLGSWSSAGHYGQLDKPLAQRSFVRLGLAPLNRLIRI